MRLPPIDNQPRAWPTSVFDGWERVLNRARQLETRAGSSDAFERTLAAFRDMVRTGRFEGLRGLLVRRMPARALTWLWLNDETVGPRLLNVRMLDTLIEAQQPRLTRLTLVQLAQLYFRWFDRLDERDKSAEASLREVVEGHLLAQLRLIPEPRLPSQRPDALSKLKVEGHWLLRLDGPRALAEYVREQGSELAATFESFGLSGFDSGRYGDVCRAHFYLETLRQLSPGEWDDVLDELLKPEVSKAPFEGDKRIGHAALEIMIDRAGDHPGDAWQNFILNLAGDPRIASSAPNFRQWWLPLGEARISKVRGWLSKEDLRLFLQAVEQYGIESGNTELQRMFPARKTFLEGLFKLKLIRNTRLMLGSTARQTVRKILGSEVKTSFAHLEGSMADKAVIYLDCGDFHLVEGSHSFKIWVYLAPPGEALRSYDRTTFSHADLISAIPGQYKKLYPQLSYEAIVHTPHTWQSKVFKFLADNGIGLDVEQLLSRQDYRLQLSKFGVPAVREKKVVVPPPAVQPPVPQKPEHRPRQAPEQPRSYASSETVMPEEPRPARVAPARAASKGPGLTPVTGLQSLSELQLAVLRYLSEAPGSTFREIAGGAAHAGANALNVKAALEGELGAYARCTAGSYWSLYPEAAALLGARMAIAEPVAAQEPLPIVPAPKASGADAKLKRLETLGGFEKKVLRYFADNPGDKVRHAANVLEVDAREINRVLYGPLKTLCTQGDGYGWSVNADVAEALERLSLDK